MVATHWCYVHRRTAVALGELLMFPVAIVWSLWPLSFPLRYYRTHLSPAPLLPYPQLSPVVWNDESFLSLVYLTAPICAFLLWKAKVIINASWAEKMGEGGKKRYEAPVLKLIRVWPHLPETGGLQLRYDRNFDKWCLFECVLVICMYAYGMCVMCACVR